MLRSIHIAGYRSLRDFRLKLDRVTVITGGNGVGKSNVYRALFLLQRMAEGRFAAALADEGGMPSALWGGDWGREPKRISWQLDHEDFQFEMQCGLIPSGPLDATRFKTDPEIKQETLRFSGKVMGRRKGPMIEARGPDGKMETPELPFHAPESMLSEVRDGIRYPALVAARTMLTRWRFYHQFRTDADSPLRRARLGSWSPVLAHDGANLAATLQTIIESGGEDRLQAAIEEAFPGCDWTPVDDAGAFQLCVSNPSVMRRMTASELSDGTLRFFCLAAALLSPDPPPLLVLNEPETSLHSGLIPPLADLIAKVPATTQILVVTHSLALADGIAAACDARKVELVSDEGVTKDIRQGKSYRVWDFE